MHFIIPLAIILAVVVLQICIEAYRNKKRLRGRKAVQQERIIKLRYWAESVNRAASHEEVLRVPNAELRVHNDHNRYHIANFADAIRKYNAAVNAESCG